MTTYAASVTIVDLPVGTTVTGAELFEAVQTSSGVGQSVQLSLSQLLTLGGLPIGGATGTLLNKSSGANYSTQFSAINTFVNVISTTGLATTGSATSIIVGISAGGIGSTQLAASAVQRSNLTALAVGSAQIDVGSVGTAQLATNIGLTGSLSIGTILNVSSTSTLAGIINNGTLNQNGNVVATGTFGVIGTASFTGNVGVWTNNPQVQLDVNANTSGGGAAVIAGVRVIGGNSVASGFEVDSYGNASPYLILRNAGGTLLSPTAVATGVQIGAIQVYGYNGSSYNYGSLITFNTLNQQTATDASQFIDISTTPSGTTVPQRVTRFQASGGVSIGTTVDPGIGKLMVNTGIVVNAYTAGVLVSSSTGVISNQGGMVLLNTLTPNGVASTNDTSSLTSAYRNYMIMFDTVCPATQTTSFQITLATTGSAFTTAGYVSIAQVDVNSTLVTDTQTAVLLLSGTRSTTQLQTSTVLGVSGFVKFFNPSSAVNNKTMVGEVMFPTPGAVGTATLALATLNGVFTNASPVTGINFAFSSGNIATGVIKIYGIT